MNIRSAELLNQSLQNAADNIYRNRALTATMQEEAQRNAIEQSFRNAMMQHYANIEQKQADAADIAEKRAEAQDDATEKKYGVMQAIADQKDAQQRVMDGLQGLSLDQKLSPAEKTMYLRQSIDAMQPQGKAAFLQNPQINALYNGQGDWDAVADVVRQHQSANENGNGNGLGTSPAARVAGNEEFYKEINQAPQQLANAEALRDPNVPKDPATGKPTLPVTVNPADAQRNGMLAGSLRSIGYPAPLAAAEGLTYGTNATVKPNITPGRDSGAGVSPAGSGAGVSPAGSATATTNSFSLAPGGINQQALDSVAAFPGGTNVLAQYGIPLPGTSGAGVPPASPGFSGAGVPPARTGTTAQATDTVPVQGPDGKTTTIPAVLLHVALQNGYKPLTQ